MRLSQYLKEDIKPTQEMIDFYETRTKNHIKRVQNNIKKIINNTDINKNELLKRSKTHDESKYSKKERIPYIWLTWWYKEKNAGRKFEYPKGIKEKIKEATKSHVKINLHHPEAHFSPTKMSKVDIAEMIADWAAISQELGNSLKEWANKTVGKKWKFTKEQVDLIYKLIGIFE